MPHVYDHLIEKKDLFQGNDVGLKVEQTLS